MKIQILARAASAKIWRGYDAVGLLYGQTVNHEAFGCVNQSEVFSA
jgi:hypothetical protein